MGTSISPDTPHAEGTSTRKSLLPGRNQDTSSIALISERGEARWSRWAARVTMMGWVKEKRAFKSVTGPWWKHGPGEDGNSLNMAEPHMSTRQHAREAGEIRSLWETNGQDFQAF